MMQYKHEKHKKETVTVNSDENTLIVFIKNELIQFPEGRNLN